MASGDKRTHENHLSKWKSPLLLTVLSLFLFESLSGFILFFYGTFLDSTEKLVSIHWILGAVTVLPYAIYQWQHYLAVRSYSSQFHYQIGLFTFFTVWVMVVSGVPLIFDLNRSEIFYTIVDMIHIVSSFGFLILLSGHLVLVARVTLIRVSKGVQPEAASFSLIAKTALAIPLAISILALLLVSFF